MRYFHSIIALIFSLGITLNSVAQTKEPTRKDKIEQLKIAYITKELNLSTEEAQQFWPAYNEMNEAIISERKSRRKLSYALNSNLDNLSEKEIKLKSQKIMESETKEVELKKAHFEKIAAIIGYKKAVHLLKVEQDFKKELLQKIRDHR